MNKQKANFALWKTFHYAVPVNTTWNILAQIQDYCMLLIEGFYFLSYFTVYTQFSMIVEK